MQRSRLTRRRALTVVASLAVFGTTVGAQVADAGQYGSLNANNINIRTGPAQSYSVVGVGQQNDVLCVWFQTTGQLVYGTNKWDNYTDYSQSGAPTGYSSDHWVTGPGGLC